MLGLGFDKGKGCEREEPAVPAQDKAIQPVRSLVEVRFADRKQSLSYYNDRFDLRCGDIVFVEGQLEGSPGRVASVSRSFKIRPGDYKKVIARADTELKGELLMAGSRFIALSPDTLPFEKALSWYMPPTEDYFLVGYDEEGESFPIDSLENAPFRPEIAPRGADYYQAGRVVYLEYSEGRTQAIVEGSRSYVVELWYRDGKISQMNCDCYCPGACKHEFAAILQFKEALRYFESRNLLLPAYFASVSKEEVFDKAMICQSSGSITF